MYGQNARRPARPSVAGRSVRLKNSATATPAAPNGPIEAEESTAANTSVSRPTITVAPEARIAGAAPRHATAIASPASSTRVSSSRYLATSNSA